MVDNRNKFYTNLVLGTSLSLFACFAAYKFSTVVLEGKNYIASVNTRYITVPEFKERINGAKKQYAAQMGIDFKTDNGQKTYNDLKKQVMQELILTKLLLQNAEQEKVVVNDTMVDQEIAKIKAQSFKNNGLEFKKALQKNEITEDTLRRMMKERITIQGYTDKLFQQNIKITDKDLQASYQSQKAQYTTPASVEAAHILVKDEKLAKDIREQIAKGADFGKLATKYSMDPGSKVYGGKLGYFSKGQMVPAFEQAAFALKLGEVSQPVKTNFGYHIIKKTGFKPAGVMPFEAVRKNLEAQAKSEKQRTFFTEWKTKALKEAEVKYNPAYESYFASVKKEAAKPDANATPANNADKTGASGNTTDNAQGTGQSAKSTGPSTPDTAKKPEDAKTSKAGSEAKSDTKADSGSTAATTGTKATETKTDVKADTKATQGKVTEEKPAPDAKKAGSETKPNDTKAAKTDKSTH